MFSKLRTADDQQENNSILQNIIEHNCSENNLDSPKYFVSIRNSMLMK